MAYLVLFLIGWLAGLLQMGGSDKSLVERFMYLLYNPFYWVFLFAAFWIAYEILKNAYLLLSGDQIIIDKGDGVILKQNNPVINLSDVEYLQIREYTDSDNATDYRLSFVRTDGAKIFIDRATDKDGIMEFAEEIADFINIPIRLK